MKLHRARKQADWLAVSRRQRNGWQRLAVRTHGAITPGNILTVLGLLMVIYGLVLVASGQYFIGLVWLAVGRFCDLLDGWLAEYTGTKSPLGALFDATADKIETAATVVVLVATGLLPLWLAILVILPHVLITGLSAAAGIRGRPFHPSRAGKLSMALAWLGLVMVVLAKATAGVDAGWLQTTAYLVCAAAAAWALWAAVGYARHR